MHLSEAVKTSGDRTSGLDLLKEALRNFHGHGPLLRSWAATLLNINCVVPEMLVLYRTGRLDLLKEALRNFPSRSSRLNSSSILLRSWAATLLNINLCHIHIVLYMKCLFYIKLLFKVNTCFRRAFYGRPLRREGGLVRLIRLFN